MRLTNKDIHEQNQLLLKQQQDFHRAAEVIADELAMLPQVQKIVIFGSVAMPLQKEIPRFRQYRRERIAVWHECKDVDLAVWLNDFDHLKDIQRTRSHALNHLLAIEDIGVAHHQVDMFLMDATDRYLGRLCHFGQCPKERKLECLVDGCGKKQFLRQDEEFVFRPESLAPEKSIVLFDRHAHQGDIPF